MSEALQKLNITELKALAYDQQRELFRHRHFVLNLEKSLNQIVAVIEEREKSDSVKPEKNYVRRKKNVANSSE